MTKVFIVLIIAAFLVFAGLVDRGTFDKPAPDTSLAERINDSCRKGYKVADWIAEGELVNVSCLEIVAGPDAFFDSYNVAVAR